MAEDRVTTILNVTLDASKVAEDLNNLSRQIGNVRNEQKLLDEEYKEGKVSAADYAKSTAAMKDELTHLQKEQKAVIATTKLMTATDETYSDSLNGQRQKLNDMLKAYDQLDKKTRESKGGKEFLKQIKEQTAKVSDMEKATGRAQRSVGQYEEALKKAGVGLGGFVDKMKAFVKNPWAMVIGAIVAVFGKLVAAFKGSEERMREMQRAFAPLKAAVAVVQQVFDALAKQLSGIVMKSIEKITEGVKWLFSAIDRLAKKVGLDWNLSGAFEATAEASKKATAATQAYEKARRNLVTFEATTEQQVAKLRAEAADKEKYTTEERIKLLEEAKDKELALANEKKRVAQLNLTALEAEASMTENDAAINDRLAEAKADVIRASTDYYNMERSLTMGIISAKKEAAAASKAEIAESKTSLKEYEADQRKKAELSKSMLDYRLKLQLDALDGDKKYSYEAYEIQMQYFNDLLALYDNDSKEYFNALKLKEQYAEEYEQKRMEYQQAANEFIAQYRNLDVLAAQEDEELSLLNSYLDQKLLTQEDYEKTRTQIQNKYQKQRIAGVANELGALGKSFNAMGDMLGQFAEENEDAAKAQKAFAFMGIMLSQAQSIAQGALAISEGVASAASIPFPGNIPAIISIVAQIAALMAGVGSSIAQSKQIFSQADAGKFAEGGVVGGTSYSGDKLIAHVNSGEGIYTNNQANALLQEIANNPARGGIDYEQMGAVMAAAVAAQPAPVVVYKELQDFGDRVTTYDEIASI